MEPFGIVAANAVRDFGLADNPAKLQMDIIRIKVEMVIINDLKKAHGVRGFGGVDQDRAPLVCGPGPVFDVFIAVCDQSGPWLAYG